jgi:type I restriction enzyme, S subunit
MSSNVKSSIDAGGGAVSVPERRFSEFHEAGAWESVSLGSVASISTKKVGDKTCIPMSITSGVGLVSQMEKFGRIIAGDSYKNYLLLQKNDFAYNKSATKEFPEGFIALYAGEELAAVPNSIFTCFRVKEDAVSPSYLNYLFLGNLHGRWLRKFIEIGARAHGSLSINDRDLLALPVPVPSGPNSLSEQKKIAECLDSADGLIAAQGRKVEALKAHKKGLMQQLFPQEGEIQPRLRFPEFDGAGEWEGHKLGDVCELYQPVTLSSSELTMTGEYLVYGANGIIGTHSDYNHPESEIAVTCRGATCGEVTRTQPMSWITGNAMVVRPRSKRLTKDYLFQFFRNHGLKTIITGSAQPQITRAGFSPLPVFFPEPAEQNQIAECLISLDGLIAAESGKLDTLKVHKKGLMQRLFPQVGEDDA